MPAKVRPTFLLVESDPAVADPIDRALRSHYGRPCVQRCGDMHAALAADLARMDLVLAALQLPDSDGLDLLLRLRQQRPDLPVVVLTDQADHDQVLRAIREGAYDFILLAGDWLPTVPVIVEKSLAISRTRRENERLQQELTRSLREIRRKNRQLEEAVAKLQTMAATDPLTGLANRRAINQDMARCFAEAQRHEQDLACLLIDLDDFKQLNDTLGHQCGDEVLQLAARVMMANLRRSDLAGRFGGDEFILLLPQADADIGQRVAHRVVEQFNLAMKKFNAADSQRPAISMSVGVATLALTRAINPEALLAAADHAMYRAKHAGKTRIHIHRPHNHDHAPSIPSTP